MKKFKNFKKSSIDTTTVIGGIGGPATTLPPNPAGTVTGHVPPSHDPKDVTKMDWYDEGVC